MHFLNFEARHLFGSLSQLQLGIVDRFFDLVRHLFYQDLSSKKVPFARSHTTLLHDLFV